VMAQVDRRLTKVNTVDRIIRVNWPGRKPGASQSHFVKIVETQVHIRRLWYWAYVMGFALVHVTKVPCGPRKTAISRDRWLVLVTVVV
jgi:hypothetical protein